MITMASDRIIFHCDLNSFFASLEEVLNPELKKVPMTVAGDPKKWTGKILVKNQLAKKHKAQTAEAIWQAKQKCPSLVCVPPHHDLYMRLHSLRLSIIPAVRDILRFLSAFHEVK